FKARQAFCTGRLPSRSRPSIVLTERPLASLMAMAQEREASPSMWTVQAPHSATPQPNFVPVSPSSSRRYQSSGIEGSPSNDCSWPLTCNLTIGSPPSSVQRHPNCYSQGRLDGDAIAVAPFFDEAL